MVCTVLWGRSLIRRFLAAFLVISKMYSVCVMFVYRIVEIEWAKRTSEPLEIEKRRRRSKSEKRCWNDSRERMIFGVWFMCRKLLQWTEEQKKEWICLSFLFFTSCRFIFVCMQASPWIDVYFWYWRSNCRYESQVERSHIWNTDLLCQKWHMRNQEIGMIISLTDPDIYYCDIE